jgi:tRNA A37 threonylcarbamoyladenosine synthetase subunit TsaC/SUA5/YrdC
MTVTTAPVVSIFDVGDYDEQIGRAVTLLHDGGVVVLPTETIYGAAGVLGNDKAISRLKAIRGSAGEESRSPSTSPVASRRCATLVK